MSNTSSSLFTRLPLNTRQKLIASLAIIGGGFIFSNLIWHNQADAGANPAINDGSITVSAVPVEAKSEARTLSYTGLVIGREEVPIYSDLHQGRINQLTVDIGDRVKAGQVLASVDDALLKIRYQQQEATVQRAEVAVAQAQTLLQEAKLQRDQAKSERVRGDEVADAGLLSREVAEQRATAQAVAESRALSAENALAMAQADLNSAKAQLAEVGLQLKQAKVIAPVSGTVTQRKVQFGSSLEQLAEPLFVIVRDDLAEVEMEIPSSEARNLKLGMAAKIQIQGDSQTAAGKIRLLAKQSGKKAQTTLLRVSFEQSQLDAIGQSAQVSFVLPSKTGIFVPSTAVTFEGTKSFVFVFKEGKAERVLVTLGVPDGNLVEVRQGLQSGSLVIDRFANLLHDGDPIKLIANAPVKSGTAK